MIDKRKAILDAALELFAQRGFYGTSIPLIVKKARVGTGTIYRYFKDKEELVNVLYRHWKQEMVDAVTKDLSRDMPLRQVFGHIWQRWIQFALDYPDAYNFMEAHHHAPYLDEESYALADRLHYRFIDILEQGRREQVIKDAPPELLMAVVGGIATEIMKKHWGGWIELTGDLVDQVEEICWEAIRR